MSCQIIIEWTLSKQRLFDRGSQFCASRPTIVNHTERISEVTSPNMINAEITCTVHCTD